MRSISPKTETKFLSRLSPDSKFFFSPSNCQSEELTLFKSPERVVNKNNMSTDEIKGFLEKEKMDSSQKSYKKQSQDRQARSIQSPLSQVQNAIQSPKNEKIDFSNSQLGQLETQLKVMREISPPSKNGALSNWSVQTEVPKKVLSPNAKTARKNRTARIKSPNAQTLQLSKELSEKYQNLLKENPFLNRRPKK